MEYTNRKFANNKYSWTKKFQFIDSEKKGSAEVLFPVFPNEELCHIENRVHVVYAKKKEEQYRDHIAATVDTLVDLKVCEEKNCTFVHIFEKKVIIINRRLLIFYIAMYLIMNQWMIALFRSCCFSNFRSGHES
jgi:hypothetical protein